jgi:cholesterol transport system auxiliary component
MPVRATYRSLSRLGAACAFAAVAAACTLPTGSKAPTATFDLGPQPSYTRSNPPIRGALLVPPVHAPSWLDEPEIVYRLMYADSARPQTYALSRWTAEPASLITDRLRSRFAAVTEGVLTPGYSAVSDYTLRVELEDFSQRFDAPGQSRAMLRARATLLANNERTLLAQRVFELERPAAPNAQGAVKALAEATDAFLEELVKWASASVDREKQRVTTEGKP